MSVLTYMEGVPLYSTINEALEWAKFKGISNYHVHKYESVAGYMGGKNHKEAAVYPGDLPTEEKVLGYKPPVGSRMISIADGRTSEYVVTRDHVGCIRSLGLAEKCSSPAFSLISSPTSLITMATSGYGGDSGNGSSSSSSGYESTLGANSPAQGDTGGYE